MKYKYCLIRQADYLCNGRCELPIYVENIYFYTLNDLKAYIAEDLYMYAQTQPRELNKTKLYEKIRTFAKYVVLTPEYKTPANKISYHHLYEDTYLYINNKGTQKDESCILGKIKARNIYWNPFGLCEFD